MLFNLKCQLCFLKIWSTRPKVESIAFILPLSWCQCSQLRRPVRVAADLVILFALLAPAILLRGSRWLHFKTVQVLTYNPARTAPHILAWIFIPPLSSFALLWTLHHSEDYFKFHFPFHGLCPNFQIWIHFLCDGVSKIGLWRAGRVYPTANAGHEERIHDMKNNTGQLCVCLTSCSLYNKCFDLFRLFPFSMHLGSRCARNPASTQLLFSQNRLLYIIQGA